MTKQILYCKLCAALIPDNVPSIRKHGAYHGMIEIEFVGFLENFGSVGEY